jgi:hypothetical protein
MAFARQTTYGQIAKELRRAILTCEYEHTSNQPDRNQLPGAADEDDQLAGERRLVQPPATRVPR